MRVRVKMCGFTRSEDIHSAVQAGADAIGFVFYPKSKRYVTSVEAKKLQASIPAFVSSVALFVNAAPSFVHEVIQLVQPTLLQFHGDETVEYCESFDRPYLKAFRLGAPELDTPEKVWQECQRYASAKGWLFDSFSPLYGGSGLRFDPTLLTELQAAHKETDPPIIIAGGIKTEDLQEMLHRFRPFAVDISSAIEHSPGIKNPEKIHAFMKALNSG